ncbi:hypothetical protein [Streptantibioticus ferralitis]|uniref:Uncharacterized protein n=1 Tax=Streptantibioticus ferralitis TaxID=236510 RepID=A0ABT5YZA6_9ACTN|nr:hypothetical protein [Streptantibioticus ferralitis]MDF2256927.1 hypothetical protein [Streptantibioticus ferralitis]
MRRTAARLGRFSDAAFIFVIAFTMGLTTGLSIISTPYHFP